MPQNSSYGTKRDSQIPMEAILKMAQNRESFPTFFLCHRLLISGEVQGAKQIWSQTVLGGGVHRATIWPMDYLASLMSLMWKGNYND